jgi:hypothetical protein
MVNGGAQWRSARKMRSRQLQCAWRVAGDPTGPGVHTSVGPWPCNLQVTSARSSALGTWQARSRSAARAAERSAQLRPSAVAVAVAGWVSRLTRCSLALAAAGVRVRAGWLGGRLGHCPCVLKSKSSSLSHFTFQLVTASSCSRRHDSERPAPRDGEGERREGIK